MDYTEAQLKEAHRAIFSALRKNEKVRDTLVAKRPLRPWQIEKVAQQIEVLALGLNLLEHALGSNDLPPAYAKESLEKAAAALLLCIGQIEKIKAKFKEHTPQHTLATRRIEAFQIARTLAQNMLV